MFSVEQKSLVTSRTDAIASNQERGRLPAAMRASHPEHKAGCAQFEISVCFQSSTGASAAANRRRWFPPSQHKKNEDGARKVCSLSSFRQVAGTYGANSVSGMASAMASGSEIISAPGGMVTSVLPANLSARSVAGSMAAAAGESGRAMCTDVKCSASVPKALETCTRRAAPPSDRWKIWRTVASCRSSRGRALSGSGICCDVPNWPPTTGRPRVRFEGAQSSPHKCSRPAPGISLLLS